MTDRDWKGATLGASPRGRSSRDARHPLGVQVRRISARAEQPSQAFAASVMHSGASPRGRSSLFRSGNSRRRPRRISARAEQPTATSSDSRSGRAHLRAGGAAATSTSTDVLLNGASPRGRSSPKQCKRILSRRRRISARAEQPSTSPVSSWARWAHLRAGGAAERRRLRLHREIGASPRGRSSPLTAHRPLSRPRRISARAEQPHPDRDRRCRSSAHLRAGGAAGREAVEQPRDRGASPRGRSSPMESRTRILHLRRISARAEQPPSRRCWSARRGAHLRAGGAAAR